MSVAVWWPLFPILFLIVLASLITAMNFLRRSDQGTRKAWLGLSLASLFYFLTFAFGRWPWLHMPVSNIAELIMVYNVYFFYKAKQKKSPGVILLRSSQSPQILPSITS
ncbi:hypothetical protein JYT87_02460 [Nitrospira defluvii]|nr:hypothetical protein [Nitrospira defluvii]